MSKGITLIVAAILAIATLGGVGYYLAMNSDDNKLDIEGDVPIFGNANGDAYIDGDDISTLESIIRDGWDKDENPLADANQDGKIDDDDIAIVKRIIAKEKTSIFYIDGVNEVSKCDFPLLDRKIALSSWQQADLVAILGLWDDVVGAYRGVVDSKSHYFPNTSSVYDFGTALDSEEELLACGADLIIASQGKKAEYNGYIAGNPSLNIQALYFNIFEESCVSTALTLGVLTCTSERAHEYAEYAQTLKNKIEDRISTLDDSQLSKVVVTLMYENQSTRANIVLECPGSGAGNMMSKIAKVYDSSAKAASSGRLNVDEEWFLAHDGTDYEFIIIQQEGTDVKKVDNTYFTPKMYNDRFEDAVEFYKDTTAYDEGKILGTTFSYSTYTGYAHLMYVAWMLYPDLFSEDEAWDALQEFYDEFTTADIDVRTQGGWCYTGTGYEAYSERLT